MVLYDNTYSRVIAWLKILLPLLALAILSTLFLVARTIDPAQDLPYADVDINELAGKQRVGRPNYSSVTGDGAAISVSAESALPDPDTPDNVSGEKIAATIELPEGPRIDITSARMQVNTAKRDAALIGDVVIATSDGYTLNTEQLDLSFSQTRLFSDQHTSVSGPIGRISADGFLLTDENKGARPYVLVFKGNVKLVYDPDE